MFRAMENIGNLIMVLCLMMVNKQFKVYSKTKCVVTTKSFNWKSTQNLHSCCVFWAIHFFVMYLLYMESLNMFKRDNHSCEMRAQLAKQFYSVSLLICNLASNSQPIHGKITAGWCSFDQFCRCSFDRSHNYRKWFKCREQRGSYITYFRMNI